MTLGENSAGAAVAVRGREGTFTQMGMQQACYVVLEATDVVALWLIFYF